MDFQLLTTDLANRLCFNMNNQRTYLKCALINTSHHVVVATTCNNVIWTLPLSTVQLQGNRKKSLEKKRSSQSTQIRSFSAHS